MGIAGLLAGCDQRNDLGKPCVLVRKDPADTDPSDGYNHINILEGEVTEGKDFISFGSVECEDYVCVRDKDQRKDPRVPPTASASGYCSRPCAPTSPAPCPPGGSIPAGYGMTCRPLILDEETLSTICPVDPETCRRVFGDTRSPYYCALSAPDAGT